MNRHPHHNDIIDNIDKVVVVVAVDDDDDDAPMYVFVIIIKSINQHQIINTSLFKISINAHQLNRLNTG